MRGSWRPNKDCNILTPPAPPAIAVSFLFSWAAQPGAWGPSLSAESWFPQLDLEHWLQALNSNCLTSCLTPGYIIVLRPLNSTRRQPKPPPDILNRMHLLFTQVHFLFWQLGRFGGQYTTLTNKIKCNFFQAAVVSILLYGCTTWTLTKWLKKKLDGNYTSMLRAILNKSWRQHPTRHQLYGHLPPIRKTIQVRRTRHAGHCWRSKDELISDVLLWTPTYGQAKTGRPARTYMQQLCEDMGCSPEDLSEAMNDREKWRERIRDIRASGTTRWWWWWWTLTIWLLPSGICIFKLIEK